ncbi:hypothetical protein FAI40_04270 [Acetobacteraceae bacterium]|nr:hypothetical protein FAI40_04270 [Acetobacteraceae bacterium]
MSFILENWQQITAGAILAWIGNAIWSLGKFLISTRREKQNAQLLRFDKLNEKLDEASKNYWGSCIPEDGREDLEIPLQKAIRDLSDCVTKESPLQTPKQKEQIDSLLADLNDTLTNPTLFASGIEHEAKWNIYGKGCDLLRDLRNIMRERW